MNAMCVGDSGRRDLIGRRGFLLGAGALCGGCASEGLFPRGGETGAAIRIAHCGDPQFAFGTSLDDPKHEPKYKADLERFERTVEAVNALRPDLCFIAGDMVNVASEMERDWPRLMGLFRVPVVVTPGNHDMGNSLTRENVERFERVFGYEYRSVKVGRWRFVSGNSQYWRPTAEVGRKARYEKWLADELAAAKANGEPVVLGTHCAPFMRTMDEPDDYENYPKAGREARFGLYRRSGVRFYLCGHTHRLFMRAHRGLTIFNAETTCCNFDGLPYGFRLLTIREDESYSWDFHRIA